MQRKHSTASQKERNLTNKKISADYHIEIPSQSILQFVRVAIGNWRFAEL